MNNQTKRGFSLVEVMILFTVLAVAMASALPLITKKSKPIPRKVAHGVYRCIAIGGGQYIEETYNTFRKISPNNQPVNQCTFRVPNASLYKVDLYSAGAGGVDYAAYTAAANDARTSVFDMATAARYASSSYPSGLDFSNKVGPSRTDMPHVLEDEQIRQAFLGDDSKYEHIIKSAFTADAGKGGDSTYEYFSPADASCLAIVHGESKYAQKENTAKSNWSTAKTKYDQKLASYNDAITNKQNKISTYTKYVEYLSELSSTMRGMSDSYATLANKELTDEERIKAYNDFKAAASQNYWNDYNEASISHIYSYTSFISYSDYQYVFVKYMNSNGNNMTSISYGISDVLKIINNESKLSTMSTMVANAALVADAADKTSPKISSEISKLTTEVNNLIAERDKSLASGELKKLAEDRDAKKEIYDDEKALHDKVTAGNSQTNARPAVYQNQKQLLYDMVDDDYSIPQTQQQIIDFCLDKFPEYYAEGNTYSYSSGAGVFTTSGTQKVSQTGGAKGKGKYIVMDYNLDYSISGVKARYTNRSIYGQHQSYPYVKFIGDLYGNVKFNGNPQGYAFYGCTSETPTASTCNSTLPSTAKDGKKIESLFNPYKARPEMVSEGSKSKLIAEDAKDVEKYLAYHVPDFAHLGGAGKFSTLEKDRATGGKGAAVGYIKNNRTYSTNNFSTNLAWETFREKGKTDTIGDTEGKAGIDTKMKSPNNESGTGYKIYELTNASSVTAQEPKIEQQANLWTKSYNLGQPGTQGLHKHIQTTTMGKRCEIHIPQGGPTLDYLDLRRQALAQSQDVGWFVARKAEQEQAKLGASITCYDDENFRVFHQEVGGGTYNPSLSGWVQPFYWYRGVGSHSARLGASPYDNPSGVSSKWAKVFSGMRTLASYGVGRPGSGTSIVDYCVVPKGTYEFKTYRMKSTGGSWTEQLLEGTYRSFDDDYDGKIGGSFDCYRLDPADGTFPGMHVFDRTAAYAGEDSSHYSISHPTSGGGGAIVITW